MFGSHYLCRSENVSLVTVSLKHNRLKGSRYVMTWGVFILGCRNRRHCGSERGRTLVGLCEWEKDR